MSDTTQKPEWDAVVYTTYTTVDEMASRGYTAFDGTVAKVLKVGGTYQVYQI